MSAPASAGDAEDERRAPSGRDAQPPEQPPPSHTIQIESDRPAAASASLTGWSFVQSLFSGIVTVANELLGVSAPVAAVPPCEEEPEREMCPICYARVPSFSAACGHQICIECSVHYVREALRDKTQVYPQGVRCPMHSNGCECFITSTTARALLNRRDSDFVAQQEAINGESPLSLQEIAAERVAPRVGSSRGFLTRHMPPSLTSVLRVWAPTWYHWTDERASAMASSFARPAVIQEVQHSDSSLSLSEVKQLHLFEVEASIPEDKRTWCPRCKLVLILPDQPPPPNRRRRAMISLRLASPPRPPDLHCGYCQHVWDPRAELGDSDYNDRATTALIRVTSKQCPNPSCGQRISHFHGHDCHHISPGTNGCPSCHQHFCYACLRPHGRPGSGYIRNRLCPHGSSYCISNDISRYLVQEPFPYDRRCGCPICPHCRRGRPCEQCPGNCVVCSGQVPPAPSALTGEMVERVLGPRDVFSWCTWFTSSFKRWAYPHFLQRHIRAVFSRRVTTA